MLETSARLLRLLSLLQMHRDWTGGQLADELEITPRTVRRDVEKLRSLGYPVNAAPGVAGGYRLGAGSELPPLLLDDDEAVAVAVGLRTAASGSSVVGIEESSLRALAKLDQVLPPALRRRVGAVHAYTVPVPGSGPEVDAEALSTIAGACRDRVELRFGYGTHDGVRSRRVVEPHRMVHLYGRWYLVAFDQTREDWRTFRVDRITSRLAQGRRCPRREPPDADLAAYVMRQVSATRGRYRARVRLHGSKTALQPRVPGYFGTLTEIDEHCCLLEVAAGWMGGLAVQVASIGVDFTVLEPPEFAEEVRALAVRFGAAARATDDAAAPAADDGASR
ncbi:YafY family protein [Patulibacter sp.]|uniref:helix-turn-helix transcriptional regulator n=1 Tax=Patulibacter sp. TaxID=1912859 RepID=UPI002717673E|nr:YafY family protein [Patulibacter sp.]MDO9407338.1 YafY family protein [Patulibacter sp.]